MAGDAPYIVNDNVGGTAAPFAITNKVKQVRVRNTHATQTLTVFVATSNVSSAAAKAAATTGTGTVAVIGADDNWTIPAGKDAVVFKSNANRYVGLSLIGSGASTTFVAEGTIWKD